MNERHHHEDPAMEVMLADLLLGQAANERTLNLILQTQKRMILKMSQEFDNLTAAIAAASVADTAAAATITTQAATIVDLQGKLDAATAGAIDPAAVQAAADTLTAATAVLTAAEPAPAP